MAKDYKMFPPTVDWDNIIWSTRKPQMDFPVQVLGFYRTKPFFKVDIKHFKRDYYLFVYMLIQIFRLQCAICSLEDINFVKPGQVSISLCTFP